MCNKTILLLICLSLSLLISACGESSVEVKDPFRTNQNVALDSKTKQRYQERRIDKQQSIAIINKINLVQEQVKKQGNGFAYQNIKYNQQTQQIAINKLQLEPEAMQALQYVSEQQFENEKNIQLRWFDSQNDVPHYMHASMHDTFIPKTDFLNTQDGKQYQQFFKKLGVDPLLLKNFADMAYEYDEKTGELSFVISDDFQQLLQSRLVLKIDGISKTMLEMLKSNNDQAPDISVFLGMLSGIRIQEIYLKMKMERTVEEIFNALPEEQAKQARQEYANSKQLSEKNIQKMAGKAFSAEQLQNYRQSWLNFLERKQAVVVSIRPEVPQALPTFFTAFMMAQSNPKILANLFKQINLKVSN